MDLIFPHKYKSCCSAPEAGSTLTTIRAWVSGSWTRPRQGWWKNSFPPTSLSYLAARPLSVSCLFLLNLPLMLRRYVEYFRGTILIIFKRTSALYIRTHFQKRSGEHSFVTLGTQHLLGHVLSGCKEQKPQSAVVSKSRLRFPPITRDLEVSSPGLVPVTNDVCGQVPRCLLSVCCVLIFFMLVVWGHKMVDASL